MMMMAVVMGRENERQAGQEKRFKFNIQVLKRRKNLDRKRQKLKRVFKEVFQNYSQFHSVCFVSGSRGEKNLSESLCLTSLSLVSVNIFIVQ